MPKEVKAQVKKVSIAREKAVDRTLGLQLISIRLQKTLVDQLKALAKEEGIGYQPYIRQILTAYVRNNKKRLQLHK